MIALKGIITNRGVQKMLCTKENGETVNQVRYKVIQINIFWQNVVPLLYNNYIKNFTEMTDNIHKKLGTLALRIFLFYI